MDHTRRERAQTGATPKTPSGAPADIVRASLPRRAAAAILDAGILMSAVLLLRSAYRQAGLYSGVANETLWFYPVAGFVIVLLYQVVFLAAMQSTPGMAFLRISIAGVDGRSPTASQVIIRVLVSILSAAPLGLGFTWALFNRQRRTWHDLAADTVVIRGSPARAAPPAPLPRRRPGDRTYRVG